MPMREVKGEIVLVDRAARGRGSAGGRADVESQLRDALATMRVKEAARAVAAATGLSRRDLYQRALAMKGRG